MPAEVLYQEISKNRIKIVGFKNFKEFRELPSEYYNSYPRMTYIPRDGSVHVTSSFNGECGVTTIVHTGATLTNDDFSHLIILMEECGKNLNRINKELIKSIKI